MQKMIWIIQTKLMLIMLNMTRRSRVSKIFDANSYEKVYLKKMNAA